MEKYYCQIFSNKKKVNWSSSSKMFPKCIAYDKKINSLIAEKKVKKIMKKMLITKYLHLGLRAFATLSNIWLTKTIA